MNAKVEVGLALSRPPREDVVVHVLVSVPDRDNMDLMDAEARELAAAIAAADPDVVMPVRSTILEVTL